MLINAIEPEEEKYFTHYYLNIQKQKYTLHLIPITHIRLLKFPLKQKYQ